jgi:molybdopterin-binding protein
MTPREAAQRLGISYPTIKKYILNGTLKTTKTPGGHHRISEENLRAYLEGIGGAGRKDEFGEGPLRVSGINQLRGEVVSIRVSGLIAEVVLSVAQRQVTAIIPAEAATELQLEVGCVAIALINFSNIMIANSDDRTGRKQ